MKNLSSFLEAATTPYHAVACVKARLMENGFSQLDEREAWQLHLGGKYFVCRGGAIVAFVYSEASGFVSVLSHSDFPALAVKGDSPLGDYLRLSVERYGGMINYTWLDRPLTVSGRVMINDTSPCASNLRIADELTLSSPSV